MQSTRNSKFIKAPIEKVFAALANAKSVEQWQAPDGMTGKMHHFDFRTGGDYEMSLYYQANENTTGKTADYEDRFKAKFTEIIPNKKITQLIVFDSEDNGFKGEMTLEILLEPRDGGTVVTFAFDNIPKGIKPEDNEEGTRQSLEKLAKFVES